MEYMLPMAIISQYGWLALHSTTHDQVFYLYLVSKYTDAPSLTQLPLGRTSSREVLATYYSRRSSS